MISRRQLPTTNTLSVCESKLNIMMHRADCAEDVSLGSPIGEVSVGDGLFPVGCVNIKNPSKKDTIWLVRISERKGSEKARVDYNIMYQRVNNGLIGEWDKDSRNRMKSGDWLGFIVGKEELVHLYYIESEASTEHRPDHWKMDSFREVVIFKKQLPIIKKWSSWKENVGYKERYMPMGTTKAKNPF